jgi:MFS transporter, UMF1 family
MNIISLYFPLWVVNEMGGRDAHVSIGNSAAMVLIIMLAPLLGALSDQAPRRMPFLIGSTAVCCLATFFIGFGPLTAGLILFVLANAAFQSSGIFYDALLSAVSNESNRGKVGGLGVSIGYVGAFLGVIMGLIVVVSRRLLRNLLNHRGHCSEAWPGFSTRATARSSEA